MAEQDRGETQLTLYNDLVKSAVRQKVPGHDAHGQLTQEDMVFDPNLYSIEIQLAWNALGELERESVWRSDRLDRQAALLELDADTITREIGTLMLRMSLPPGAGPEDETPEQREERLAAHAERRAAIRAEIAEKVAEEERLHADAHSLRLDAQAAREETRGYALDFAERVITPANPTWTRERLRGEFDVASLGKILGFFVATGQSPRPVISTRTTAPSPSPTSTPIAIPATRMTGTGNRASRRSGSAGRG